MELKEINMKLTNKELRQKLNELMDEIISVKEWIFNAIEIEPELPEMKKKLKDLEKELSEIKATENN